MPRFSMYLTLGLILTGPAHAHLGNDQAYAPVVEQIAIDGDLSDWPAQSLRYPVLNHNKVYGPTDIDKADLMQSPDLTAYFMVGYSPTEQLLYVAVSVRDDSLILGTTFLDQDAVEIYVDGDHSGGFIQAPELSHLQYVVIPGDATYDPSVDENPWLWQGEIDTTRTQAAYRRQDDRTTYEWAVQVFDRYPDLPTKLTAGKTIGFDVVVVDNDGEEYPSAWICWAPAASNKNMDADRLGHLVLGEAGVETGILTGSVREGQKPLAGILIEAYQEDKRVGVGQTNARGTYHLAVLPGTHTIKLRPGQGYQPAASQRVQVQSGAESQANLQLVAVEVPPILEQVAAAYESAEGYRDSLTVEMTSSGDGVDIQTVVPLRLAWQPPDRLRLEGWMEEETLVVSDGNSMSFYLGSFQQYMQLPVSERIDYNRLPGRPPGLGVACQLAMSDDPAGLLTRGLEQAEEVGGETVDGKRCILIELVQGPLLGSLAATARLLEPLHLRLWIDEQDFILRQVSYELQGSQFVERYSHTDLTPDFAAETFVFEPPTGAEKTDMFGGGKEKELIGHQAPDFVLTDYQDTEVKLTDFAGQVLLVDFWGTWCPPCLEAMPKYVALHQKYADQGFNIIGIAANDRAEAVEKYAAENDIEFPLPLADDQVLQAYQIMAFPTTFLVDREGVIQLAQIGEPEDFSAFEDKIKALLSD